MKMITPQLVNAIAAFVIMALDYLVVEYNGTRAEARMRNWC